MYWWEALMPRKTKRLIERAAMRASQAVTTDHVPVARRVSIPAVISTVDLLHGVADVRASGGYGSFTCFASAVPQEATFAFYALREGMNVLIEIQPGVPGRRGRILEAID
jgi:hypothetical protein